jgi:hypothetical protein
MRYYDLPLAFFLAWAEWVSQRRSLSPFTLPTPMAPAAPPSAGS